MTTQAAPQLAITRTFNAPRGVVYEAFTDPDQVAQWWGPAGNYIPRDEMRFDVRTGGSMEWSDGMPAEPEVGVRIRLDLAEVVQGELLDGTMHVAGRLPGGFEPFQTRMRIEFHDTPEGGTRLEIRQWLAENLVAPTENGWAESFAKLDTVLAT